MLQHINMLLLLKYLIKTSITLPSIELEAADKYVKESPMSKLFYNVV